MSAGETLRRIRWNLPVMMLLSDDRRRGLAQQAQVQALGV
jgi:hypothetical protein